MADFWLLPSLYAILIDASCHYAYPRYFFERMVKKIRLDVVDYQDIMIYLVMALWTKWTAKLSTEYMTTIHQQFFFKNCNTFC
jgi:hypothetical protein